MGDVGIREQDSPAGLATDTPATQKVEQPSPRLVQVGCNVVYGVERIHSSALIATFIIRQPA
jgi:hypothetical protein